MSPLTNPGRFSVLQVILCGVVVSLVYKPGKAAPDTAA